jgi:hypothetical protein
MKYGRAHTESKRTACAECACRLMEILPKFALAGNWVLVAQFIIYGRSALSVCRFLPESTSMKEKRSDVAPNAPTTYCTL